MEQLHGSAIFMASMILIGLGILAALVFVLIANNLLHKYWKSLNWTWYGYGHQYHFVDEQQPKMEPKLQKNEEQPK